ncbi:hypothetical protein SEVIR_7G191401v4 [Setaria viridis]
MLHRKALDSRVAKLASAPLHKLASLTAAAGTSLGAGGGEVIAERPAGTDNRQRGGRRSLSSTGEARWRLRRRRPIEKRGGSERSGEISASLSARAAPGLHTEPWPAIHPRFPAPPTTGHRHIYPRRGLIPPLDLSIDPSSADESEGGAGPGLPSKLFLRLRRRGKGSGETLAPVLQYTCRRLRPSFGIGHKKQATSSEVWSTSGRI